MGYNGKEILAGLLEKNGEGDYVDGLKKKIAATEKIIGRKIAFQSAKNGVKEEGNTYFLFTFQGEEYLGSLSGTDELTASFAALLPTYLEDEEVQTALSKTQFFKKALEGEATPALVYQYSKKYAVQDRACFVAVLETGKMLGEVSALSAQYGENGLDFSMETADGRVVLLRFCEEKDEISAAQYAEFLSQFIKEELGVGVRIGVGPIVKDVGKASLSYREALDALRYGERLEEKKQIFSYKDFVLAKMLEELPPGKLSQYFSLLSEDSVKEIFDDEEMVYTVKEFLNNNLNVSEAARNMYLHRNTLTYRLDKIERATGLNVRIFADAVTFYLLSLLHVLIGE